MIFKREKYLNKLILYKDTNLVKIISGLRRVGKSFLLNNIFYNYLINNGVNEDNIIRFSFENIYDLEKLNEFNKDEKLEIYDELHSGYKINYKKFISYIDSVIDKNNINYLLLDEIQLLSNFELVLNSFLLKPNLNIFVTGSNSRFLSSDIVTIFRGRSIEIRVEPLSFKEIYDESIDKDYESILNDYLEYGGLPYVVINKDINLKKEYLKNLFTYTYLKDILEHNSLKNELALNEVLNILASDISCLVSPRKLENTYKSKNYMGISKNTIMNYLNFFLDSFLINKISKYDIKGKKYIDSPFKCYFNDLGLRNARLEFRQLEDNHLIENLVYNTLKYRNYEISFGSIISDNKSYEVDFIANKDDKKYYIQVTQNIDSQDKLEQEIKSLNSINDSFNKILIVKNINKSFQLENGINVLSLKEFLLENNLK